MQRACVKCGQSNPNATGLASDACPGCGAIYAKAKPPDSGAAAVSKKRMGPLGYLGIGLLVFMGLGWVAKTAEVSRVGQVKDTMEAIKVQVATDAMNQYSLASKHGSAIDVCVQAGFVTAALLQAQKEKEYAEWKSIEANDCGRAGVSR